MSGERPQFVLFGDSITQMAFASPDGWAAKLADDYTARVDVFNRGFSGYNTRWANAISAECINTRLFPRLELVVLFFGANDAVLPGLPEQWSRQHVPLAEFESHVGALAARFGALTNAVGGSPRVLVVTPPPVDEAAWLARTCERWAKPDAPLNRSLEAARAYAAAAARAAATAGALCVDLCSAMLERDDWRTLLSDGLHLAPAGSAMLHELIRAALDTAAPRPLSVERFALQFPASSELTDDTWKSKLLRRTPGSWL